MDNLSTTGIDISNQIGALELGDHMERYDDGMLETVGATSAGTVACTLPPVCR